MSESELVPAQIERLGEELFSRYRRLVGYYLHRSGIAKREVDDIFNTIFFKVQRGLKYIKHRENLKAWVMTIARNELLHFLRRRKLEELVVNMATVPEDLVVVDPPQEGEVTIKQIKKALARLSEELRAPLELRYFRGLRWRDVASRIGIEVDAVRKRASKGIALLGKRLRKVANAS